MTFIYIDKLVGFEEFTEKFFYKTNILEIISKNKSYTITNKQFIVILFHDIHSYPDTVGKFFYELSGYKFVRDGSFGLGVLCQDKGIYEFILSLSNSIDNYINSLEQSVPESE